MCVPIAERRREVRFDGRKTLNLQVFNGPPLSPSWTFPLCLSASLLLFTIDPPPTLHTEYSTKQSDRGTGAILYRLPHLLGIEKRAKRLLFPGKREGDRGRFGDTTVRVVALAAVPCPPRMEDTHPLLKYALCQRPNGRNEACLL